MYKYLIYTKNARFLYILYILNFFVIYTLQNNKISVNKY